MTNPAFIGRRLAWAAPVATAGAVAGGLVVYFLGKSLGISYHVPQFGETLTHLHVAGFAAALAAAVIALFALLWLYTPKPRQAFLRAMGALGIAVAAYLLTVRVDVATLAALVLIQAVIEIPLAGVLVGVSED